jgi:hypothetical protein
MVYRPYAQPGRLAVEQIGLSRSWEDLRRELRGFAADCWLSGGWLRNRLRIRISGRRALRLAQRLFGPQPEPKR